MSILHFLLLLLVAGVCGSLGRMLAGSSRGGWLVSIALGFVGALVGTWLAQLAGLPAIFALDIEGQPFPVVWSILGSALFVAVLGRLWRRGAGTA
jgi:uncharacterized membrane protein YeaQ/YmgE (transglycosylase-associated protein family)